MNAAVRRRALFGWTAAAVLVPAWYALAEDDAADRAPFGLTWGSTIQQIQAAGATLAENTVIRDFGRTYDAKGIDRVLFDMSDVLLSFGWRDKLIRIFALGRPVPNDPFGNRVVGRYQELIGILADRYGTPRQMDHRDTEMYKAPNEYVASLKQGRAWRYASFQTGVVEVELSIRASDFDTARYALLFEHKLGMQAFAAYKRVRERDAL